MSQRLEYASLLQAPHHLGDDTELPAADAGPSDSMALFANSENRKRPESL